MPVNFSSLSNVDPFSKLFHRLLQLWICSKTTSKISRHLKRVATLYLWNVCAQKSPCSGTKWSELTRKAQPFDTVAEKYSFSSWLVYVYWWKDIHSGDSERPMRKMTHCSPCSNQEERRRTKRLRTRLAFRKALMASVSERVKIVSLSIH